MSQRKSEKELAAGRFMDAMTDWHKLIREQEREECACVADQCAAVEARAGQPYKSAARAAAQIRSRR